MRKLFFWVAFFIGTGGFVGSRPVGFHQVHESGFFSSGVKRAILDMSYWQNQPVMHFCIVTLMTYIILLVIALIGTYIPVKRASHILPADALRDE